MEYRNLGKSGLKVSAVGVGCNNFGSRADQTAATKVVDAALELGVNFFDTADIYGSGGLSEQYLGKALAGKRDRVVVATKFGGEMGPGPLDKGASRGYVMRAVEASLRRLDTSHIDLYQVHFPDPSTPLEETMSALDDLVHQGKVRYIGHSNFAGWQTSQCHYLADLRNLTPFISAQNQYNLLDRSIERELVPACQAFGLSVLPYFPLASGLLTGKYRKGQPLPPGTRITNNQQAQQRYFSERNWNIIEGLAQLAERKSLSMTDLAFGWFLSRPYIGSVIAGAMTAEQVRNNVKSAEAKLDAETLAEIDTITLAGPV
jgi:aryl-alcohol dehydrogenase-like predicted oxidoreductase